MTEDPGSRPKLRRIKGKHWLGGVCAGMGYWLRVPTWLLRLGCWRRRHVSGRFTFREEGKTAIFYARTVN